MRSAVPPFDKVMDWSGAGLFAPEGKEPVAAERVTSAATRPGYRRTYSKSTGRPLMPTLGGAIQCENWPAWVTAFWMC